MSYPAPGCLQANLMVAWQSQGQWSSPGVKTQCSSELILTSCADDIPTLPRLIPEGLSVPAGTTDRVLHKHRVNAGLLLCSHGLCLDSSVFILGGIPTLSSLWNLYRPYLFICKLENTFSVAGILLSGLLEIKPLGKGGGAWKANFHTQGYSGHGEDGLGGGCLMPWDGRKGRQSGAEGMVLGDSPVHAQPARHSFPHPRQAVAFGSCLPVAMAQLSMP